MAIYQTPAAATLDRRPIRERLAAFYTDLEIRCMMVTPQEALADRTPGELIIAGRAEEVHQLIDRVTAQLYPPGEGAHVPPVA